MKAFKLLLFLFTIAGSNLFGATFYLDPVNGNITNDGSFENPLPSLEEVVNMNLIGVLFKGTQLSKEKIEDLKIGACFLVVIDRDYRTIASKQLIKF